MALRILVVDDSSLVREVLRASLAMFPDLTIVGEAGDGLRALKLTQELKPDVITMDVLMPMMDGLETVQAIMRTCPTPIVVVADARGDTQGLAMSALARGATEVFPKPPNGFVTASVTEL